MLPFNKTQITPLAHFPRWHCKWILWQVMASPVLSQEGITDNGISNDRVSRIGPDYLGNKFPSCKDDLSAWKIYLLD